MNLLRNGTAFSVCSLTLTLACILPANGAEIEVRLVAADRADRPPVSLLEDFRNAADGGLIGTQWISGVTLGGKPLFPIVPRGKLVPDSPDTVGDATSGKKKKPDVDDLLGEIQATASKKKPVVIRPVDVVDPLYRGATHTVGREVGPQRSRASTATINVTAPAVVQPGGQAVSAAATRVDILCYPLVITATVSGREAFHTAFTPTLTWQGRDLLADCLFEHSPDLPLGDVVENDRAADSLQGWLDATRGGKRLFQRLTIYLPANAALGDPPYELNGNEFQIGPDGVVLITSKSAPRVKLRQTGNFGVQLLFAGNSKSDQMTIPLLTELGAGWNCDTANTLKFARSSSSLTISITSPSGEATILRPQLPVTPDELDRWHLLALVTGGRSPQESPAAHLLAIPKSSATDSADWTLRLSAEVKGNPELPASIQMELTNGFPAQPQANTKYSLTLQATQPKTFTLHTQQSLRGFYTAKILVDERKLPPFPVVMSDSKLHGAVTPVTYHNRCDYYRGEQVQASVVVRATKDIDDQVAQVVLRHESGDEVVVGKVTLRAAAGETRSTFVTLQTDRLPLGRHDLRIESPNLLNHSTHFTLFSPLPKSTFALYSWAVDSFSGPARVSGESTANLLLSDKPTKFLAPHEVARFTDQATLPTQFRAWLASDPLYPVPEKTDVYDEQTERELAVAMRMGIRFAPEFGWGMNGQEASWNPKHTHPEDLARMQRLCSLVAQRFRDFGNYAGLHLNWYPTLGGYWEDHPPTDGHAARRATRLAAEVQQIKAEPSTSSSINKDEAEIELAVQRHKYRVGAFARAYQAWTERSSQFLPGLSSRPLSNDVLQPGLSPTRPVASSFLPISWFDQQAYYPSVYFSTLPAATVHAYTDYGFSPFQPLWGLDFWAAGVGDKPRWVSTMSNGRDIILGQALLAVARGADGVDLKGSDPQTSRVVSQFLTAYGPLFRSMTPESDVAIVTSLRQQLVKGKLVNRWMGYTGGTYFDLYTKLWYARRPPAVLLEEEVTSERLAQFKAVFLVNQQTRLPEPAMQALNKFAQQGGRVFKDAVSAADFPGELYLLGAGESSGPTWDGKQYMATRDQMFVGVQAAYEASAKSLDKLLTQLPPPRVSSQSHQTLLGSLAGRETAVVMAVNDTRTPPGIYHPWNFWSATILAADGKLTFDKPYAVYDLLDGGRLLPIKPGSHGRFELTVSFDRCAGRALFLAPAPVMELRLATAQSHDGSQVSVNVQLVDERSSTMQDSWPVEISLVDEMDRTVETIYRALGPQEKVQLVLPSTTKNAIWRVVVRELVSGITASQELKLASQVSLALTSSPVLLPRPDEVRLFLATPKAKESKPKNAAAGFDPLQAVTLETDAPSPARVASIVILLDQPQVILQGKELTDLAEAFAADLRARGRTVRVVVADPLDLVEIPQRWQATQRDQEHSAAVAAGQRIAFVSDLRTRFYSGEKDRNKPDFLHPHSGYNEPAARSRIGEHVILLGTAEVNRYLAELHAAVGQRASAHFPAPGGALVQVAFDAFMPDRHALSIQSHDITGLRAGIATVLKLHAPTSAVAAEISWQKTVTIASVKRTPLSRPVEESFGATVTPIAWKDDGGVLVGAGLQAHSYFQFNAAGQVQRKWLGKYSLQPSRVGAGMWTSTWWGAPGLLDKVVRCDDEAQPQWQMSAPRFSRSFQHWSHPGHASLADRASNDLFVAGHCRVARVSAAGKTLWMYDDSSTAHDVPSFRFRRDMMLHDVSPDGQRLLVAAFGIEPYANFASKFVRPSLLLFDAKTGRILFEKPDILVDHSVCRFGGANGERIIVGDANEKQKRLLLLDLQGREAWSIARPQGVSEAALTADETKLIVRPETPRDKLRQVIGEPQGLQIIDLTNRTTQNFPNASAVSAWQLLTQSARLLISTSDGTLALYKLNAELEWQHHFNGSASFLVSDDERQLVVGTPDGHLRWFDMTGRLTRDIDLMPFNRVTNLDEYVHQYTRTPGDVPNYEPLPELPPTIEQRGRGVVQFSKNLLESQKVSTLTSSPLGKPVTLRAAAQPGKTHVLSLVERGVGDSPANGRVAVEVWLPAAKSPFYKAELPLSATWEERTVGWKMPSDANQVELKISFFANGSSAPATDPAQKKSAAAVELRHVGLFELTYPSSNLFAQRASNAAVDPLARKVDPLGAGAIGNEKKQTPPDVRFFMPNDVDLTNRARGAPPFQRVVEFTTPFDGRLQGQPTSWLNKPLAGSTHATLEIKLSAPTQLGSLAVYEDPTSPAHYSDTYALFVREAKTGRTRQVGNVVGNRSPFNLFTFPAVEADSVTYLWLKSNDGHARVMELEGYRAQENLLD